MLKRCPRCTNENGAETSVCVCGFEFIEPEKAHQMMNLSSNNQGRLKFRAGRILVFAAFFIGSLSALILLVGFSDFFPDTARSRNYGKETSALIETNSLKAVTNPDTSAKQTADTLPKYSLTGKVTAVTAGDLITVADESDNQEYKIRLIGVDAPEINQNSRQSDRIKLSDLILNKSVLVFLEGAENEGIFAGRVYYRDKIINAEMINSEQPVPGAGARYSEPELRAGGNSGLQTQNNPPVKDQIKQPSVKTSPEQIPPPSIENDKRQVAKSEAELKVSDKTPTALCADGTYSYSKSISGACSYHGGVARQIKTTKVSPPSQSEKKQTIERKYQLGSRGGCYYVNPSGNKTYVDRSLCN